MPTPSQPEPQQLAQDPREDQSPPRSVTAKVFDFPRNAWYVAGWDHEVTAKKPLARTVAERDGGELGADSTPGEGSVFWVDLPAG